MSSAGHIFDMIRRIEANRAQVRSHREQAERMRRLYAQSGRSGSGGLRPDRVPPERSEAVRRRIRGEMLRERRRRRIAGGVAIAVSAVAAAWLMRALCA